MRIHDIASKISNGAGTSGRLVSNGVSFPRRNRIIVEATLIFFFCVAFFSFLARHQTFPDPDSFYHAKMGMLVSEGKILRVFPWLSGTILQDNFVDHHFLYHLLLAPFILVGGALGGATAATIIFSAIVFVTLHLLLRFFNIHYAPLFTAILFVSEPFLFRMNLVKASSLSVLFFLLLLWALWRRRPVIVFFISFFYVWLFNGWPIGLLAVGSIAIGIYAARCIVGKEIEKMALRLFFSSLLGFFLGIIVNPYFPANLSFFWQHIIRTALSNPFFSLGGGAEWEPLPFFDAMTMLTPLFLAMLFVFTLFLFRIFHGVRHSVFFAIERLPQVLSLGIASSILFVMMLVARRFIEYFIPVIVLFAAFLFTALIEKDPRCLKEFFSFLFPFQRALRYALITPFLILVPLVVARDFVLLDFSFQDGHPWTTYRSAAQFLKERIAKNAVVLNVQWEDFPALFYWDNSHRYVAGLDPAFSYLFDREKYNAWKSVLSGENIRENAALLGASAIFVNAGNEELLQTLTTEDIPLLYSDAEARIYAL